MNSGIYKIEHVASGRCYVGQSQNVDQRLYDHLNSLAHGKHPNVHLQRAWDKYGEREFNFSLIENCPIADLSIREQHWIDTLDSEFNRSRCTVSFWRGMKHSEETKKAMAERMKGNRHARGFKHSDDAKARIKASATGRWHTEETKHKQSLAKKGKPLTPEHVAKLSLAQKTSPLAKEARANSALARVGKPLSEFHRKRISAALKGKIKTADHLAKIGAARRGKKHSEEAKAKMRESAIARWAKRKEANQ